MHFACLYRLILFCSNPMRKGEKTLKKIKSIVSNLFHLPLQTLSLNLPKLHEVLIAVESLCKCTVL